MKILTLILSFIFINNHCSESKKIQSNLSFEYTAVTRGYYKKVIINNQTISIFKERNGTPKVRNCSETKWHTLNSLLETINLEQLPNLESPSDNRFVDRAAIANLTIHFKGETYKTEGFDDGNPPREIAELVKEILSMSENID